MKSQAVDLSPLSLSTFNMLVSKKWFSQLQSIFGRVFWWNLRRDSSAVVVLNMEEIKSRLYLRYMRNPYYCIYLHELLSGTDKWNEIRTIGVFSKINSYEQRLGVVRTLDYSHTFWLHVHDVTWYMMWQPEVIWISQQRTEFAYKCLKQQRMLAQYSSIRNTHTHIATNIRRNNFVYGTQNHRVHHSSYVSCFHRATLHKNKCTK